MRVLNLHAENLKKLYVVDIQPDTNVVQITGANSQGKSSILDAIFWGLTGKRGIQAVPIRRGAERALIKIGLGDKDVEFKVTRTFNLQEGGDYTTGLTVEAADGARFGKGQDVLNSFLGEFTFDPLAFGRLPVDQQFDVFKGFVPGVDFGALAADDKRDYDARTAANRIAKSLRIEAEAISLPAGPVPARVDLAALESKLAEAATHNSTVAQRKSQREIATARIEEIKILVENLLTERRALEEKLADAPPLPDLIDIEETRLAMAQARETNAICDRAAARTELIAKATLEENASAQLTRRMTAREADKQEAIARAKMPVEGIGFAGETVTLDGLPFDQASTSRQIRVGCAIAAALNPKLRIAFIHDGSLLDRDAMAWLEQWAEEQDMQVWCEVVGDGPAGFVIEDGRVRGAAAAPGADEVEEGV